MVGKSKSGFDLNPDLATFAKSRGFVLDLNFFDTSTKFRTPGKPLTVSDLGFFKRADLDLNITRAL